MMALGMHIVDWLVVKICPEMFRIEKCLGHPSIHFYTPFFWPKPPSISLRSSCEVRQRFIRFRHMKVSSFSFSMSTRVAPDSIDFFSNDRCCFGQYYLF